ncbi:MAG: lipoate synthase [Bacteroidetes bacterium]|nr:lipoate synthase [Bacteroidota bacterium]
MERVKKPEWLKIKLGGGQGYSFTNKLILENNLHTICVSGRCPNLGHCWNMKTATFMVLGDICTRSCKFCATKSGRPLPVDESEIAKVANSIKLMELRYCVITSVDRDDLPDQGANFWAKLISEVKKENPNTKVEVLIPDFDAKEELLDIVLESQPDILGHNMETVKRLTPQVRSRARYERSLEVQRYAASKGFFTKSGIMLGLGETESEVIELMQDLRGAGCQLLTIGQYLQPTKKHLPVQEYIHPDQFAKYKAFGLELGFKFVESGPLVRSSYMAETTFNQIVQ